MLLDKRIVLNCNATCIGITHTGTVTIGHKRRCPTIRIEPAVCLNEEIELEVPFLGMGTFVGKKTVVKRTEYIGRFSYIGEQCYIGAINEEFSGISNSMITRDNRIGWYSSLLKIKYPEKRKLIGKTKIGNDVWIGDNVIVFQGVDIGDGAVVLSGTTVTENIPPYAIAYGNPANIFKYRFDRNIIEELLKLKWWEYGIDLLKDIKLDQMSMKDIIDYQKQNIAKYSKKTVGTCCFKFEWSIDKWIVYYMEAEKKQIRYVIADE